MAENPTNRIQSKSPLPDRFKIIAETPQPRRKRRDPAGSKPTKSGRTPLNTTATEELLALATTQFGAIQKCGVIWGPDEDANEVAGYLASPDTPGFTPIRHERKGGLVLDLDAVFKKHPKLRPAASDWVSFSMMPEGYFIIHLGVPLPRVKPSKINRKRKNAENHATASNTATATGADTHESA